MRHTLGNRHRRRVRLLPLVKRRVDVGSIGLRLDLADVMEDLDPGFRPREVESAGRI